MADTIPTARLEEIREGCEGVQGGPWKLDDFAAYVWAPSEKGGDFPLMDEIGEKGRVVELRGWGYYTGNGHGALGLPSDEAVARQRRTGEHVARLDPQTISAIVSELIERRAVASPQAEIDRLREAAQGVIASWDERLGGEREQRVPASEALPEYYWSPSASMVASPAIAKLRAALHPEPPNGGHNG